MANKCLERAVPPAGFACALRAPQAAQFAQIKILTIYYFMNKFIQKFLRLFSSKKTSLKLNEVNFEITPAKPLDEFRVELTSDQLRKLNIWRAEVSVRAGQKQIASGFAQKYSNGQVPYYGASGGGYVFTIIPGGVGYSIKVKEMATGEELDLSDYENW